MTKLTEREALDLIRATATRTRPECINLPAIDRILAEVAATPATAAPLAPTGLLPALIRLRDAYARWEEVSNRRATMGEMHEASSAMLELEEEVLEGALPAAIAALAASPAAPLADGELQRLADQAEGVLGLPWRSPAGAMQVVYGGPLAGAVFVADTHLAPSPEEGQRNADYLAAAANALPGLLARLADSEAFRAKVIEVLTKRRNDAHTRFTEWLEENGPEGVIDGAEAADEISKIARNLGLTLPDDAPTTNAGKEPQP